MNIDDQAIHDLLTRQIDLMRFERSVARDALRQLERMQEEVEANLRRRELSALNRRDLERLLFEIDAVLAHYYGLIGGMVQEAQTEVVADEHEWLLWWLGGLSAAYVLDGAVKPLPAARLADLSAHALVGGLTLSEAVAAQRRGLFDVLKRTVRLAAADGASFDDVADVFKRQAAQLRTLTRTWAGSIQGAVHYAFGSINPLVKGWRHVAVLDGHTSGMCTARHGLVWDKKKQPVGHAYPFRRPPLHPNCRSRLAFVFDLAAPFHGITGEDWVKGRTLPQLQEQFGHGIGQMLHDGEISLADAVRSDGLASVTLAELKQKTYAKMSDDLRNKLANRRIINMNVSRVGMRSDWNNFPDVVLMHSKSTISGHSLYQAAKGGDLTAAVALVDDYLNDGALNEIGKLLAPHENVRLLPVHAVEMSGRNKLPAAYAAWLEQAFELPIEYGIVQADKVGRTGADGFERLVKSVRFDGEVVAGQKYLLIDDAVTQGGTIADLRGYIESSGGIVVGVTALMGKPHSARLAITKPTLGQLRKSLGRDFEAWWQEQFGYDFSKLTESEARYINKQITRSGVDAVRDTIIARRLETVGHSGS